MTRGDSGSVQSKLKTAGEKTPCCFLYYKYLPVMLSGFAAISCGVPTATTRPPRPGEIDGVHYFFISEDRFREMVDRGDVEACARLVAAFAEASL